jgi:hypothetical protein
MADQGNSSPSHGSDKESAASESCGMPPSRAIRQYLHFLISHKALPVLPGSGPAAIANTMAGVSPLDLLRLVLQTSSDALLKRQLL